MKTKSIIGFNNYVVSDTGFVKNTITGKILKFDKLQNGYFRVTLSKNGETKRFSVHRLVATYFITNPKNKLLIHHLDGNRRNNNVNNLVWVTHKEHAQYHEKEHFIEMNNKNKKKVDMYDLNCNYIKTFDCIAQAAKFLLEKEKKELNRNNIKNKVGMIVSVCKQKPKRKSYKGYVWRYN